MNPSRYFAGVEEVLARIVAIVLSIAVFAVYESAKGQQSLSSSDIALTLAVFVVVYDLLAFMLFILFSYFSRQRIMQTNATDTTIISDRLE